MPLALPASTPLPFVTTSSGVAVISGLFLLTGWAVEETTATGRARFVLRDGLSAAGDLRVPVTLGAGESSRDTVAHLGIVFESGLFVDVTAGSVQGCIFGIPLQVAHRESGVVLLGQQRPGEWLDVGQLA